MTRRSVWPCSPWRRLLPCPNLFLLKDEWITRFSSYGGSSVRTPTPTVDRIDRRPETNGDAPGAADRHSKRTWYIAVLAVTFLIVLGWVVHW